MALPTVKQSRAARNPLDSRVVLAGQPKAGKTTLLSQWAPETTLIVDTHSGTLDLDGEHYVAHVTSWERFVSVVDDVVRGGHHFRTIAVDLIDDIYMLADQHVARKRNVAAAQLVEYGKGDAETQALYRREIGRLFDAPVGIWLVAHTETEEVGNVSRFVPKLHKKVRGWTEGMASYVWLLEAMGPQRVLHTAPSARFQAGSRTAMPNPMTSPDAQAIYAAMAAGFDMPTAPAAPPAPPAPAAAPAARRTTRRDTR